MTKENKWVVVSSDMDGLTGHQVVHSSDVATVRSGSYWGGLVKDLSLDRAAMQKVADELNARNEPPPENPYRRGGF